MVSLNEWAKIANLIMVVLITILTLNRLAWSTLVMYDPLHYAEMKATIHLANLGTIGFFIHTVDQYIREFVTPESSSWCNWNFKAGAEMLVFSYFAVWLFYWHRHRVISRGHTARRLSIVGLILVTFSFIVLSLLFLLFWGGELGPEGLCVIDTEFAIGTSKYSSGYIIWTTIFLDIFCSAFLCCVFFVPLCGMLRSLDLGDNDQSDGVGSVRLSSDHKQRPFEIEDRGLSSEIHSTRRMKLALQRTACAAVLSAISTTVCLILLREASRWHYTLDEEMSLVNLDGLLTAYSIHISLDPKLRWFWSWFKTRERG